MPLHRVMPGTCILVRDEEVVATFQVSGSLLALSQHLGVIQPALEFPHLSNPKIKASPRTQA